MVFHTSTERLIVCLRRTQSCVQPPRCLLLLLCAQPSRFEFSTIHFIARWNHPLVRRAPVGFQRYRIQNKQIFHTLFERTTHTLRSIESDWRLCIRPSMDRRTVNLKQNLIRPLNQTRETHSSGCQKHHLYDSKPATLRRPAQLVYSSATCCRWSVDVDILIIKQ